MSAGIYGKAEFALPRLSVPGRPDTRAFIQYITAPGKGRVNLSLLLNKGLVWWEFNGKLHPDGLDRDAQEAILSSLGTLPDEKKGKGKTLKNLKTAKSEFLESIHHLYQSGGNLPSEREYSSFLERHFQTKRHYARSVSFTATTAARLQISARTNPMETGLVLHPLYGFPFLPGSAIKGLTAAGYLHREGLMEELIRVLPDPETVKSPLPINLARLPELIRQAPDVFTRPVLNELEVLFGIPGIDKTRKACKGKLIFMDAWPAPTDAKPMQNILDQDCWTVHYPKYYGENKNDWPGDDQDPNPLPQLTVAKGVSFQFCIMAAKPGLDAYLNKACESLKYGLTHLSIGAKPDYGFFNNFKLLE